MSDPNPPTIDYASPQRRTSSIPWKLLLFLLILAGFAASLIVPPLLNGRQVDRTIQCSFNLSSIGKCMQLYANDHHGAFPDRLDQLIPYQEFNAAQLICPSSNDTPASGLTTQSILANIAAGGHCSYIYIGKTQTKGSNPETVLAYEPPLHRNGGNVLFGDGHVEFLDAKTFQQIIALAKSAVRPVIWPPPTSAPATTKPSIFAPAGIPTFGNRPQ